MMKPSIQWIGALVLTLALVSFAQLLYFSNQQSKQTECQARVNQTFLETVKSRAEINASERTSIETLVTDLSNAKDQQDATKAFREFDQRKKTLEILRNSFEYPDVSGECK